MDLNDLDALTKFVARLKFSPEMGEKDLFVFGNKLGDGGEDNLFQLGFTCLTMLKRIKEFNNFGCFHVDATYKIVKFCFPLIVFGFTDVSRRFFPIAFMFTSHEKQTDYLHFFASLLDTYNSIGIDFKPTYMLCDACHAIANAVTKCFPKTILLMCWFHLKQNFRKNKNMIPPQLYTQTLNEINNLHYCLCAGSYKVIY